MTRLQSEAAGILTDSGGMQKEAYWLRVPCVTLRDETEWVETLESGWNTLAGSDRDRIIESVLTSTRAPVVEDVYWGAGSADRLVRVLADYGLNRQCGD
jgi:UDP-N-acetylglucosamine 2-epimerase